MPDQCSDIFCNIILRWQGDSWIVRNDRTFRQPFQCLLHNGIRPFHLPQTHDVSIIDIPDRANGDFEIELLITRIGKGFPHIVFDSRATKAGSGHAPVDRILFRNDPDAFGPLQPDHILRQKRFIFFDMVRKGPDKILDLICDPIWKVF